MNAITVTICVASLLALMDATPFGSFLPQNSGEHNNSSSHLNYTPINNFLTALRKESSETVSPFIAKMRETFRAIASQIVNLGVQVGLLANQVANNKLHHLSHVVSGLYETTTTTTEKPTTAKPAVPTNATSSVNSTAPAKS